MYLIATILLYVFVVDVSQRADTNKDTVEKAENKLRFLEDTINGIANVKIVAEYSIFKFFGRSAYNCY